MAMVIKTLDCHFLKIVTKIVGIFVAVVEIAAVYVGVGRTPAVTTIKFNLRRGQAR